MLLKRKLASEGVNTLTVDEDHASLVAKALISCYKEGKRRTKALKSDYTYPR